MVIYMILGVGLLFAILGLGIGWKAGRQMSRMPDPEIPDLPEEDVSSTDTEVMEEGTKNGKPYLSAIVYAFDRSDRLGFIVEALASQRAEFPYEVIFVCNATARETAEIAEIYSGMPGVRFTFVPPESHNLSRRKLAFTVGIKAAMGEVVLLTGANMDVPSAEWFRLMARPFMESEDTGMVLGSVRFPFKGMHGLARLYRQYLFVMGKSQSLGSAIEGKPYRGDWGNLAFRKELFFKCKGFASTISIETGDDDVFVCEASRDVRTAVVLNPAAMPESRWGDSASRIWKEQRIAYGFTRRWLPQGPFLRQGFLSLSQWIVLAAAAASAVLPWLGPDCRFLSLPSPWVGTVAGGLLWIAFEGIQIFNYRRAAARLSMPKGGAAYPLFALWRPIGNMVFRILNRSSAHRNFTWNH